MPPAGALICVSDLHGIIKGFGSGAASILEERSDFVGTSLLDLPNWGPETRQKLGNALTAAANGRVETVSTKELGDRLSLILEPINADDNQPQLVAVFSSNSPTVTNANPTDESFRILVDSVKDYAIFLLTPQGYIASWNAGAERAKGYTASEIIGKHFSVFYTESDRLIGKPSLLLRKAELNGRVEEEGWRVRKDGTLFFADVIITSLHWPDGSLRAFAKITRDMTEKRQLTQSRDDAVSASHAKSAFLANMSHELRTPLNAILGYCELIQEELLGRHEEQMAQDIGKVASSSKHLLSLISDILDLSRIESGCLELKYEKVEIAAVIQEVVESIRPLARTNHNSIAVEVSEEIDWINADRTRLRQILYNLLSNANKFTSDGEIRICVCYDRSSDQITIRVQDSGIGIPAAEKEKIFERFYQLEPHNKPQGGTGLGLAISKLFCVAMGGSIGVDSTPGKGSSFNVTIPAGRHPIPVAEKA